MIPADPTRTFPDALQYHRDIRDFLRAKEPGLWEWFSSTKARQEHVEAQRLDLLKTTVRLDAESQPALFAAWGEVATRLGLDGPQGAYGELSPAKCAAM